MFYSTLLFLQRALSGQEATSPSAAGSAVRVGAILLVVCPRNIPWEIGNSTSFCCVTEEQRKKKRKRLGKLCAAAEDPELPC